MAWWGKLAAGAFGFMLGGPLGALLGAYLGHQFDVGLRGFTADADGDAADNQERVQAAFFTATFAVMGHVAKADGRVSRDEIALAEKVMHHMRLDAAQRDLAKSLFNEGRQPDFDLDAVLRQLRDECGRRRNLVRMFMEIQIQAALADGTLAPQESDTLKRVARGLGISDADLQRLINLVRGGEAAEEKTGAPSLTEAYRILGVKAETPLPEIRKAYRRLLSRHHPDKLVAKGLPEEMIRLANRKTHEIRSAWERVKAERG